MSYEKVELTKLGNGGAEDLFNHQLQNVLENIKDVNTDPKAKRSILMKIEIIPSEDRNHGAVNIHCTSKLAGKKPAQAMFAFGEDGVYESKLAQGSLDFDRNAPNQPIDLKRRAAGERDSD